MKKKETKTKKEPKPEDFKTQAEAEEAAEEYMQSKPVYTIINFFIGHGNKAKKIKSNVEGKPNVPPY